MATASVGISGASQEVATVHHSRATRLTTMTFIAVPPLLLLTAVVFGFGPGWRDFGLMIGLFAASILAITLGNHRYFTHRSYQTSRWMECLLAIASSMAVEGSVINWVANHRLHHGHSDREGDPHSPHISFEGGRLGRIKGFLHAHMGWLFNDKQADPQTYAPDLLENRMIVRVSGMFLLFATLSLVVVPFLLGWVLSGFTLGGGLSAVFWAGLVRLGLAHHFTWSVNSACHLWGRRDFESGDQSTNNPWLAIPTFGEAWHNNHHAFPSSARHGQERWQIDLTYMLICVLERLGLVWDVRRIAPDRLERKRLVA